MTPPTAHPHSDPSWRHRPWVDKELSLASFSSSSFSSPHDNFVNDKNRNNNKNGDNDHHRKLVENGSNIYIGSCAATSSLIFRQLLQDPLVSNMQVLQLIPGGQFQHLQEDLDRFRTISFYNFTRGVFFSRGEKEGLEDYKPMSIASVPRLLRERKLTVDVAILKVTPPHKGFVSLGTGVDATKEVIRHARIVLVEVCEKMPWTEGPSKVPCSDIDYWVALPRDEPLLTTRQLWPQLFSLPRYYPKEVLDGICANTVKEIPDRATLRFGVTPFVSHLFSFLEHHHDLGLHTDVLTEGLFQLHKKGVITNKYKTLLPGCSIVSQAHGSQELYEWVDRNPVVEFHPSSFVCDPQVLGQMDNLVVIVGALKVDVTGQVATDSISHKFYGGVWTDDDSIRGARYSKGGKPMVILPSKSLQGRSNIVFSLPEGTGVAITRSDVEYVITEHGTAHLFGKSIRERCLALIEIAHPDFRAQLLHQAKEHRYVSQSQPGKSFESPYPREFEVLHTTTPKSGKPQQVFVRPIKAVDEDMLRDFFHKLSDHSVYLRYFRLLRSMPLRILQRTADVDYTSDMAIVALHPPGATQRNEIVGIAQWVSDVRPSSANGLSPPTAETSPEIAFQVRDDWQGQGLGSYLFQRLIEIAKARGLTKLKADVLTDNAGMNAIIRKSKIPFTQRSDFGVTTYYFDLTVNRS